ncbi:MAG: 2-oxo acid dehydrogenase subunit E2 [Propionibacteriaceae bacterium]|jgi:2-oxoglutarate dehydrogenase E2 component (dihydrolipoamide succinyltransferase)|nr:2-oxo acid dehydrogenase subunit E2 [Propionibacteriaceae bacterium]
MTTQVTLPALGESVFEGTVSRWLKQVGDRVEADEPLLEISTDKVDTEIPAPTDGVLLEIRVREDETAPVGTVLALIGQPGEALAPPADPTPAAPDQAEPAQTAPDPADSAPAPTFQATAPAAAWSVPVAPTAETAPPSPPALPTWAQPNRGPLFDPLPQPPAAFQPAPEPQPGLEPEPAPEPEPTPEPEPIDSEADAAGSDQPFPVTPATVEPASAPEPAEVEPTGALRVVPSPQVDLVAARAPAGALADSGPYVTPLVRRLAAEHGIDLTRVAGSGVGGRIRKEDILTAAGGAKPITTPAPTLDPAAPIRPRSTADQPDQPAEPAQPTPTAEPIPPAHPAPAGPAPEVEPAPAEAAPTAAPAPQPPQLPQPPLSASRPAPTPPAQAPAPPAPAAPVVPAPAPTVPAPAPAAPLAPSFGLARPVAPPAAVAGTTEPISRLRASVAQRMVESLQVAAQLTATVEVDLTAISKLRTKLKDSFQAREGVSLTYLPFITKAAVEALKQFPKVNATIDLAAGLISYADGVHVGVAVDTPRGLLVPVVRNAGDLTVGGLAKKIADLARRTRSSQVTPDELAGGTFTITNYGSAGTLFDTPIINQPQVAILGAGALVKRPVVVADARMGEIIAVRDMMYLSLTYDHRLVDGADAARFLTAVKARLEQGEFAAELGARN